MAAPNSAATATSASGDRSASATSALQQTALAGVPEQRQQAAGDRG